MIDFLLWCVGVVLCLVLEVFDVASVYVYVCVVLGVVFGVVCVFVLCLVLLFVVCVWC